MNIFSNIGITELVVILLLALLVVGPERLPEMGRKLAEILRDLRKAYDNLTKELGPEFQSIQQTTQELRESVESVTSIPRDVVKSVVEAADLDDTVEELKGVTASLDKMGKTVSQAGNIVKNPVAAAVDTAKDALVPSKADKSPDVLDDTAKEALQPSNADKSVDEPDDAVTGDEQLQEEIDAAMAQLAQDTPQEQVSD